MKTCSKLFLCWDRFKRPCVPGEAYGFDSLFMRIRMCKTF